MQTSMIIVDNFFDNPMEVRRVALGLDYPKLKKQPYFPGRNSRQKFNIEGLVEQASRLVGERLTPMPDTGHAKCRITLDGDKGEGSVHVDESHWSGIIYLSLPEHCQGGTDFFRHLPTDSERAPSTHEELAAFGYTEFKEVWDKILAPDTNDPTKWERTMRVPMRFNRLVLLRPWLWHNAGPSFGDCLENGRLIHLSFFDSHGVA